MQRGARALEIPVHDRAPEGVKWFRLKSRLTRTQGDRKAGHWCASRRPRKHSSRSSNSTSRSSTIASSGENPAQPLTGFQEAPQRCRLRQQRAPSKRRRLRWYHCCDRVRAAPRTGLLTATSFSHVKHLQNSNMPHLMHAQVERLRRARIFNMTGDGSEEGRNDAEDEAPE